VLLWFSRRRANGSLCKRYVEGCGYKCGRDDVRCAVIWAGRVGKLHLIDKSCDVGPEKVVNLLGQTSLL
jgi:hypothetical protein